MALAHSCSQLIDISLPITPALPVWPGDPRPALEPVTTLESHGVQVSRLILSTHAGTHVDAPRHVIHVIRGCQWHGRSSLISLPWSSQPQSISQNVRYASWGLMGHRSMSGARAISPAISIC
jgi:hypothetical protein